MQGHQAVLLSETVERLVWRPDGIYVDATLGWGGHSAAILERLDVSGRLYALDCDGEAIAHGRERFATDSRFFCVQDNFSCLDRWLNAWDIAGRVDGILMDLGVSSIQLDRPQRGFSFRHCGPLDLRLNQNGGSPVAEWLNAVRQDELADVLWQYGEERYSRRIAAAIVAARQRQPVTTTTELAALIAAAVPRHEWRIHPATRSFLALRLWVNAELQRLREALPQTVQALSLGGRLVVISFHSLEDRIVKHFLREHGHQERVVRDERGNLWPLEQRGPRLRVAASCRPQAAETANNRRSRSALLRQAERIA